MLPRAAAGAGFAFGAAGLAGSGAGAAGGAAACRALGAEAFAFFADFLTVFFAVFFAVAFFVVFLDFFEVVLRVFFAAVFFARFLGAAAFLVAAFVFFFEVFFFKVFFALATTNALDRSNDTELMDDKAERLPRHFRELRKHRENQRLSFQIIFVGVARGAGDLFPYLRQPCKAGQVHIGIGLVRMQVLCHPALDAVHEGGQRHAVA